tara:strand:- start:68 stop:367 length:300 start_codon:yes stop_codon:yes gene_type:complete
MPKGKGTYGRKRGRPPKKKNSAKKSKPKAAQPRKAGLTFRPGSQADHLRYAGSRAVMSGKKTASAPLTKVKKTQSKAISGIKKVPSDVKKAIRRFGLYW